MRKLLYIVALVCTAVACSKSEQPAGGGYPADGVVRIRPTVAAPVTRAEGSTEFEGSRLGLGLYYGDNDRYNKTALWKKDADGNWNSSSQLLWKNAEDEVVVYAFVPDVTRLEYGWISLSEGIPSDQSAGLESADWLWCSEKVKPGEALDDSGKLNVEMNHALLKLTVNLGFGNEFGDAAPAIKEVWLNGTTQKVSVCYQYENRGQISISSLQLPMDIKMHKAGDNCYEAIFYPSTGQMKDGKMLTVVLADGRDYTLKLAEDLNLEKSPDGKYLGGCAYSMSVKIGKDKLVMGAVTVADWNKKDLGDNYFSDATEYSEWDGPEDVANEYAGGEGTAENPYQIATAAQLALMAQRVNNGDYYIESTQTNQVTYFKLTSDIDLMGQEWTPIGYEQCSFCGIFDGGGHTILNLNVTNRYAGLFGVVKESAEIKNLTIRNASVKSRVIGKDTEGCSGIVAGKCEGQSSISNCSVEGSSSGNCYVGGIVGRIDKECKIRNCTAVVSCLGEEGSYSECGGIAGKSSATIENCTVRGNIKGTGNVGGFVGTMDGGKITSNTAQLSCSYADVSLYSIPKYVQTYNVGGLVGECKGNSEVKVEAAAAVFGTVSVEPGLDADNGIIYLGGYIGYAEYTTLGGHFWGSIEAAKPSNGTLEAGIFMGYFGTGVTTGRSYCMYDKSRVGDLPIYGAKADGAKDDDLANIIAN